MEVSVTGWWAVNQLLLRRQKPKWWSSICLLITHLQQPWPPTCSTYLSPTFIQPPLLPVSCLPGFHVSHAHPFLPAQEQISAPLLTSPSTSAIFLPFPILSSLLFSPPAGPIPREGKRRSALSQHRFTFLPHSVWSVRKQDWCLWTSSTARVAMQSKTPSKSRKHKEILS